MAAGIGSTAFDAFLSSQEADELMQIVCDEPSEGWSFDSVSRLFNSTFSKGDHYRIGKALEMFLLSGVLDKSSSQLVAVYLLYDMFKEQPLSQNVFAPLFFKILHPELMDEKLGDFSKENAENQDLNGMGDHLSRIGLLNDIADWFLLGLAKFSSGARWFVATLAAGPQPEVAVVVCDRNELTPFIGVVPFQMFSKPPTVFANMDPATLTAIDISQFDAEFVERHNRIPVSDRSGVSCVIDYPDVTVMGSRHEGLKAAKETADALVSGQKPQPDLAFIPELMRPVPPVMPLNEKELVWMNPRTVEELKLYLDPTMLVFPPKWLAPSQLIVKAVRTPLHVDEQATLTNAFEQDSTLILGGAVMTTDDIMGIVEHNPTVATEIFKRVHRLPENAIKKTRFKKYLNAFLDTNISVHTMEVINRLQEANIVPNDFLPLYVSYALRKCDAGSAGDQSYNQTRLVRLVCVFIQSAVRNKTLNLAQNPDLLVEIQAFCVKQTSVKEALALYRFLKNSNLDSPDNFESNSNEGSSPSKINLDMLQK